MKTHLRTLIVLLWTAGCSGSTDGGEPIAPTYTLTVTIAGQGNGEGTLEGDARLGHFLPCTVKNGVATAANGAACRLSPEYSGSGTFTLTGAPNAGSTFGGWNGCSSGSGDQCTLSVNGTTNYTFALTARFDLVPPPPPPGIASVTVSPSEGTVESQKTINLNATVALESGATGTPLITWTSSDELKATVAGTGASAVVTGKAIGDVTIRATATLGSSSKQGTALVHVVNPPITVNVAVSGTGGGNGVVTSQGIPTGDINCTSTAGVATGTCQASFSDPDGKGSVTLTAAPAQGSTFGGWTGCTSGSSTCTLNYDSNQTVNLTVTAKFDLQTPTGPLGANEFLAFDNARTGIAGQRTGAST